MTTSLRFKQPGSVRRIAEGFALSAVLLLLASFSAFGAEDAPATLAVGVIASGGTEVPAHVMTTINDVFYTSLATANKFKLVERGRMEDINREALRSAQGEPVKAPTPEQEAGAAIKAGELTGAQYMLVGSLVAYAEEQNTTQLRPDVSKTLTRVGVKLDCRIVETQKGEIKATAHGAAQLEEDGMPDMVRSKAIRQAVDQAVDGLCATLFGAPQAPAAAAPEAAPQSPAPAPPSANVEPVAGQFLIIGGFLNTVDNAAPPALLDALGAALETGIQQTKRIPVAERADDRYLDEIAKQTEGKGFFDPKSIANPQIKGAKYYVANRLVAYRADGGSAKDATLPNVYHYSWAVAVELQSKIIDIPTGVIAETFQIKKEVSGGADTGKAVSGVPEIEIQHAKLAQQVADELTAGVIRVCCPLLVAAVANNQIYLNQGASMGIQPGTVYGVFQPGEDITDPQTGKVLGKQETYIGDVEVVQVEREMAIAAPVVPSGAVMPAFAKGMLCKPAAGPKAKPGKDAAPRESARPAEAPKPEAPKSAESGIPKGMERVFALAPMLNSADAPRRATAAFRDGLSKGIQQAGNTKVVTRDEEQLAGIGKEYLGGKSRFMDDATRLKTLKLVGCRYMVFLEVTDWISKVSTKPIPMTNESIDIQEVQMRVSGTIVDLKTGQVLCSAQSKASSLDDGVDAAVTVDGQGDLDMDAKIAEKAAKAMLEEFRNQGALK